MLTSETESPRAHNKIRRQRMNNQQQQQRHLHTHAEQISYKHKRDKANEERACE